MCDTDQRRTGLAVQVSLRGASFVLAALLGCGGGGITLALAVMAVLNPEMELNLAVWLAGVVGACMGIASLTIVGFAMTAGAVAKRVDANAERIRVELLAHRQAFTGDVAAFQEGVAAGVARTVDPIANAIAQAARTDNVVPFPHPGAADRASFN
ncbi:hypothetical protein KBX50_08510 [Micromonospora sp. C51]|uniref:hypothetical protein n=1 Tax=Micromonospora sp. C51 TaxID=2824879 RepID=UPI001B36A64F|nr:hypothetical protein [Micromonospora sp. C51]MBQ1048505.1 hypothetical protein [Micromonospora sp. C51]